MTVTQNPVRSRTPSSARLRWLACLFSFGLGLAACSPDTPQISQPQETEATNLTGPIENSGINQNPVKNPTETGAYLVTLRPESSDYVIGKTQNWIASVTDAQGNVFTPSTLYFDGGMAAHGHGLPSAPEFTRHLGGPDYLLEGMQINMPGDWRFVVTVGGPAGVDNAVFELNIQPGPVRSTQAPVTQKNWSSGELALIESMRLDQLPAAQDASNRFMGNPKAIELGQALFNDPMLSASGEISCATCHLASKGFADGKQFSVGSKQAARHTPSLLGAAHADWFYWDGRRDSLWSQALTPIETVGEMDNNRTDVVRYIASHPTHADAFRNLAQEEAEFFPELSDATRFQPGASPFGTGKFQWHRMSEEDRSRINRAYSTLGKIIASFEAELQFEPGRFDKWAKTIGDTGDTDSSQLSAEEQAGLRLFLDLPKTQCLRCHNGPMLTNNGFHNVATSTSADTGVHDFGRMLGLQSVIADPFNCSGEFSDAPVDGCEHLRFARRQNLGATIDGAFKVPSLRNLSLTAPYFHDGRFDSIEEVMEHYRNQLGGDKLRVSEVPDIDITDTERDQLIAFLKTL